MWWLIGNATDFWGRGPMFESGISHIDSPFIFLVYSRSFYVPEHSIMQLTVSARFLISSGREGE